MPDRCDHRGYSELEFTGTSRWTGRVRNRGVSLHWCGRCGAIRWRNPDQSWSHWEVPEMSLPKEQRDA